MPAPMARASATDRRINSFETAQSSPIPRWAGSMASATEKPSDLHSFCHRHEVPRERCIAHDVFEEQFPLDLEGVLELSIVGYVHPLGTEIDGVWNVRVPDGSRRVHAALHFALTQTGHRTAMRAVHL